MHEKYSCGNLTSLLVWDLWVPEVSRSQSVAFQWFVFWTQGLSEELLRALLASVEDMGAANRALFEAAAAAPPLPRPGRPARGRGAAKPAAAGRRRSAGPSESEDEV